MTHEEVFRNELIKALHRELVGPDLPPHGTQISEGETCDEVLSESPMQRYSAGVLFPQKQPINEVDNTDESEAGELAEDAPAPGIRTEEQGNDIEREGSTGERLTDAYDETIRLANEFFPSAIGLSFLVEYPQDGLVINAKASVYKSQAPVDPSRKLREWHRSELNIEPVNLKFPKARLPGKKEFRLSDHLVLRAIYHPRDDGSLLVTVSMLNTRTSSSLKPPSGASCYYQVGFDVVDPEQRFLFKEYRTVKRTLSIVADDLEAKEEAALELLYRRRMAYAVGHGCSADWGEEVEARTNLVRTMIVPHYKVPPIEPLSYGGDELSMYHLSGAEGKVSPQQIPKLLNKLADDYEDWLRGRTSDIAGLPADLQQAAKENLKACDLCLARIRSGIAILRANKTVLQAFMLANRAMLMQQYHSHRHKRSTSDPWMEFPVSYEPADSKVGRWRTFQIAFILMNLPSIVPQDDGSDRADRRMVDLIWFPTGGGKTEAYLGLATCDVFFRRLSRPTNAGCTVLMRYTLRVLTSQQFQRASSLICACELIRRGRRKELGEEPITIGLWVGESLTPTHREDAIKALNDMANPQHQAQNPFQLLVCPWCGTALDREDHLGYAIHSFTGKPKTVVFVCPESRCPFSERKKERNQSLQLPVMVIDDDIYDWPPTLLIGTVDKFAMLAWRKEAGRIFGLEANGQWDPPDLIIQDELHLISGPLGSVVGLFEASIDLLCSWKGREPKIVSSTATIRRAWHQCKALYNRQTFQFPPQALDISDSYFAREDPNAPGRIYVGILASAAPSFVTAVLRTLSALFQSCKSLPLPPGATENTRDPYWTVLQYFNSLRELGHARTLVEADIPEYMWAIASRSRLPRDLCRSLGSPVELTSRRTADEIPEILERLGIRYPRASEDGPRPLDTLLATNMISVGVDVDRLGTMVVVGQPKTTSEYIQATSRVGRSRSAPGLIVTMYNPGKPRDRSHYEHFRAYHEAFYKYVEPTSVTPYSLPVLKRALHAVLVILTRHLIGLKSPEDIEPKARPMTEIVNFLYDRCENIDPEHAGALMERLHILLDEWSEIRPTEWGRFGHAPADRALMHPAGSEPPKEWQGSSWSTPSSMRNVDVECEARVIPLYESKEQT